METFARYLRSALEGELPGISVQRRMMPRYHDGTYRIIEPGPLSRKTAIAVVLCAGPAVLLTLRSQRLRYHRGQISCPGGRIEEGETVVQAALRELWEEVGIASEEVDVLGMLSPLYTPPSDSVIMPVVVWWNGRELQHVQQEEVEEVFTVPLDMLRRAPIEEEWCLPYGQMIVPHWRVHRTVPLWGATAMVLVELLWFYEQWLIQRMTLQA